ncbi:MAG: hypothetical protein QF886_27120, partial [Planctomycetota bacterium]|nr:hypothetical protein [Planctomycetota bacterium]
RFAGNTHPPEVFVGGNFGAWDDSYVGTSSPPRPALRCHVSYGTVQVVERGGANVASLHRAT